MESSKRHNETGFDGSASAGWFKAADSLAVPEGRGKEKVWAYILNQINQDSNKIKKLPNKPHINWRYVSGIAASLLLVFVAYALFFTGDAIVIETGKAEIETFFLPDGSKVTLNADSKITYSVADWKQERKLALEGEAYFEVAKGEKFTVMSGIGNVEVLGTSFNIFARHKNYRVDCFTGKVKVSDKDFDQYTILTKGLSTSIINNELQSITQNNLSARASWLAGEFHYEETPLSEVFEEFERQFDVKVSMAEEFDNELYTGYFSNKNLDEGLEFICAPMGLSYQKKQDSILISDKKLK